jgi:transcriptional regulator with XRE-family HTH domain
VTATLKWSERLRTLRRALKLDQDQMGELLDLTREWVSKLEREKEEMSERVQLKLEKLERENAGHIIESRFTSPHLKTGGKQVPPLDEPRANYETVASRIPIEKRMPTRADCEDLLNLVLDAAEAEGSPENIPVIYHRLRKQFPLDEWEATKPDKP